ncbi:M15 family metallopeptidase [Roseovarius amoyensis]|uniref:M15 family metallopeptidase n=1 Tax=Roseovarius amoyensis TaxID=2211448 RepID=UPI000DBE21D8|nr:M15 family metallopeptidase [Roseovarius amoyensis]
MKCAKRVIQRFIRRGFNKAGGEMPLAGSPGDVVRRLPQTYQAAAVNLVNFPYLKTRDYRHKKEKTDRTGVHPWVIEFFLSLQKEFERRGYPMFAFEFYRSDERQQALYVKGVTKARGAQSAHNWGCAVDIVHCERFWDLTPKEWGVIGAIGKEVARKRNLQVVWGGDWDFYDPAHWQLAHWRDVRNLWEDRFDWPEIMTTADFLDIESRLSAKRLNARLKQMPSHLRP